MNRRVLGLAGTLLLLAVVVAVFLAGVDSDTQPSSNTSKNLEQVELGEIEPLTRHGNLYLGGQPSPADMKQLDKLGFRTIINLRKPDEISWDESEIAGELGLKYVPLPFQSSEELTDELFDAARTALRDRQQEMTLLHCASSNRVGAIWYAYRVIDGGLPEEEARQEAKQVGLRSPALLKAAEAYVEKQKNSRK